MGKYLVLALDDGTRLSVHLRMTGKLLLSDARDDDAPTGGAHARLVMHLDDGRSLIFDDQRKFGRVAWYPSEDAVAGRLRLGPDPTDDDFTAERMGRLLKGRVRPIKSLLLDQSIISGIGNIYADEALFRAGVHPQRPSGGLESAEVEEVWRHVRAVLFEGIEQKGTSLRDYVDADGRQGAFQNLLRVYGREGKPCLNCGGPIARMRLAGRSSFHCPTCQH